MNTGIRHVHEHCNLCRHRAGLEEKQKSKCIVQLGRVYWQVGVHWRRKNKATISCGGRAGGQTVIRHRAYISVTGRALAGGNYGCNVGVRPRGAARSDFSLAVWVNLCFCDKWGMCRGGDLRRRVACVQGAEL